MRPTAPALAVCVCTMSGRKRCMSRHSFQIVTASRGESSRLIDGITSGVTPCAAAKPLMSSSPGGTTPVTSTVSTPSRAIPSVSQTTCRAGPPTFSRAMIRSTRMSVDSGGGGDARAELAVELLDQERPEAHRRDEVGDAAVHVAGVHAGEAAAEIDLRTLVDPQRPRVPVDGVAPPLEQLAVAGVEHVPRGRESALRGDAVELAQVLARQDYGLLVVARGVGAVRALLDVVLDPGGAIRQHAEPPDGDRRGDRGGGADGEARATRHRPRPSRCRARRTTASSAAARPAPSEIARGR